MPSPGPPDPAAETKIQELAGIVKLLRRGMKELQGRANEFVAAACKFEKEVGQQVRRPDVRLGSGLGFCRWAQQGPAVSHQRHVVLHV